MLTKQTGDVSELAVSLYCMKKGWGVLQPIGDYLPYDLVLDLDGRLLKIQVKTAWYDVSRRNYVVDNRRTRTNRRSIQRSSYRSEDFDFAVFYLAEIEVFYVMPVADFLSYKSEIHLVETEKRQRKPRSAVFREAWHLLETQP